MGARATDEPVCPHCPAFSPSHPLTANTVPMGYSHTAPQILHIHPKLHIFSQIGECARTIWYLHGAIRYS